MPKKAPTPEIDVTRSVHQICTADGLPYKGYATACIWVNQADPYAKTDGNRVTPLLCGEDYYSALADAIAQAKSTVYMLGWQINWDVMLKPAGKLRLYDALLSAAQHNPALKIYILPWANPSQMDTLSAQTKTALLAINGHLKKPQVFVELATQHSNSPDGLGVFFAHHQKQVVIDEKIGFIGGLDVAYGRRDTATYDLHAKGRLGNDAYNGCLPHFTPVKEDDYVDGIALARPEKIYYDDQEIPDVAAIQARANLQKSGFVEMPQHGKMLNVANQPRMPWQDVHLKIEGPGVSDLASNFVLRWNSARKKAELGLPPLPAAYPVAGSCCVQLLRSASDDMVALESKYVKASDRGRVHDEFAHNHIHHAMVRLIEHADHFIYIENQFFVSAFGTEHFGDNAATVSMSEEVRTARSAIKALLSRSIPLSGHAMEPPTNKICEALGEKLRSVIMDVGNPAPDGKNSPFHVYITLPVHPEGTLDDMSVMSQVHFTMQTLVFGKLSLINRIRRAIKARQLLEKNHSQGKGKPSVNHIFEDANDEYKSVPIEACWPYVTLLNLRNWAELPGIRGTGSRVVTEQIYVHTKMMIVDDRYAIVGSANINDRSLLGYRDSEMAVLVMDTEFSYEDIGAAEGPTVVRKLARNLRIDVWNKIFGNTGGIRPAGLEDAIKRPAAQQSWQNIRRQAEDNSKQYEAVFPYIPRNYVSAKSAGGPVTQKEATIWPATRLEDGAKAHDGKMPFDQGFWTSPQHVAAASLKDVHGYITLLPWRWTEGQNNNAYLHSALITEIDKSTIDTHGVAPSVIAANDRAEQAQEANS